MLQKIRSHSRRGAGCSLGSLCQEGAQGLGAEGQAKGQRPAQAQLPLPQGQGSGSRLPGRLFVLHLSLVIGKRNPAASESLSQEDARAWSSE